ncbi:SpoIIE family protein phosphatase [Streptomyces sp. NPDC048409]|uniref:ATP-binding SpoIIE family protein phosphatase n=1 Tax=Streptomyces sp. NPDC048409 TaxID=3154723 RepID=UPI003448131D
MRSRTQIETGRAMHDRGETRQVPHRGTFDISAAALLIVDSRGKISYWSDAAQQLLGHTSSEVLGHPANLLLVHEAGPSALPSGLRQAERGWLEGVIHALHSGGQPLRLAVRTLELDCDGASAWLVAMQDPISLHASEFRAAAAQCLLEESSFGVAALSSDLTFQWANVALAEMEDMHEGKMSTEGKPSPAVLCQAEKVLKTGCSATTVESVESLQQGRCRVKVRSSFPLRVEGSLLGVCHTELDIPGEDPARHRLSLLNEASERIGTTLDLERTVHELAEVLVPCLADFVAVDLLDSVQMPLDAPTGSVQTSDILCRATHLSIKEDHPEVVIRIGAPAHYPEESPQRRCLLTGKPIREAITPFTPWLVKDPLRWCRLVRLGVHTHLTVPLRARGVGMGVVTLMRWENPHPFDEDDLLLVEELISRAAICVDNARRYARQQQAALTLQTSLLPHELPDLSAADFAHRYLPADAETGVGGDWFDVIPLSGARVALVVGDVVGHGIHAAASMGRLRAAVQTLADLELPPDELLAKVDDYVVRISDEADAATNGELIVGATCLYGVYDPIERTLVAARAGHPGPAIAHLNDPVEFPEIPAGPPLGLGGLPFESTTIQVPEGSIIALYTDGLIEAAARDVDIGYERLCFALAHPDRPLEEICDTMISALLPDRPFDDVAFLIARTRSLSSDCVVSWDIPGDYPSVHAAREKAAHQLEIWHMAEISFVAELIVSELVTNAIRHATGPISLRLIHDRTLICEVSDASSTSPRMRRATTTEEGGRGLFLIAQLSQRWGARYTPLGKTIWAEVAIPVRD